MNRRLFPIACCVLIAAQTTPAAWAASQPDLNFKIYSPPDSSAAASGAAPASGSDSSTAGSTDSMWSSGSNDAAPATTDSKLQAETPATDSSATPISGTATTTTESAAADADADNKSDKVLKGYIRVVPSGTKVPIIMDTAVDSDTSQEGDEFAARTSEDLNIDGTTIVPAGSVIKGRIAGLNAPKNLGRSGSVALKFDTVTTPDNRQIPLVANLVARGGVVHAKRGLKDIAMDTGTLAIPVVLGLGIGVLAGNSASNGSSSSGTSSSNRIDKGTGALIGAGVGVAIGVAILAIKKGKKVDVRPGDELKIELAEDLRMPM